MPLLVVYALFLIIMWIMLENIKVWDKIVYMWANRKEYILVEIIEDVEVSNIYNDWEVAKWLKIVTVINKKYCIDWPLTQPTPLELEVAEFTWLEK